MAISSMTGFARAEGRADGLSWAWEVKSVNGRALDTRFRLPPGFDGLEIALRAALAKHVKRGSIAAALAVTNEAGASGLRINRAALATILAAARELAPDLEAAPPRLDGLLALRGVIETGDEPQDEATRERRESALVKLGRDAGAPRRRAERRGRAARGRARRAPEAHLRARRGSRCERRGAARRVAPASARARRGAAGGLARAQRGSARPGSRHCSPPRSDVREELDRLGEHIAAAHALLAEGGAVGGASISCAGVQSRGQHAVPQVGDLGAHRDRPRS